jgi:DNA-binding response OmpR family regulator
MTMVWRAEDRPARVLVVEDEALIAMDLQAALCRAGCDVVGPVAGIKEAAHLAAEERLDAAVLDIGLLDGEAWSAADILVRRGVPFVFFTGYELERLPERFRGRPVLGKPSSVEGLPAALMAAAREQRVRQRAYAIWEREGRPEGRAEGHWAMAAEEELRAEEQVHAAD